jgi:hypothetical protein
MLHHGWWRRATVPQCQSAKNHRIRGSFGHGWHGWREVGEWILNGFGTRNITRTQRNRPLGGDFLHLKARFCYWNCNILQYSSILWSSHHPNPFFTGGPGALRRQPRWEDLESEASVNRSTPILPVVQTINWYGWFIPLYIDLWFIPLVYINKNQFMTLPFYIPKLRRWNTMVKPCETHAVPVTQQDTLKGPVHHMAEHHEGQEGLIWMSNLCWI